MKGISADVAELREQFGRPTPEPEPKPKPKPKKKARKKPAAKKG